MSRFSEDGGNNVLQNVGIPPRHYMAP